MSRCSTRHAPRQHPTGAPVSPRGVQWPDREANTRGATRDGHVQTLPRPRRADAALLPIPCVTLYTYTGPSAESLLDACTRFVHADAIRLLSVARHRTVRRDPHIRFLTMILSARTRAFTLPRDQN